MAVTGRPDVVIVGAGAGGAAAAWRLCSAGLKVLILEAGPRFDPAADYPLTAPDWERSGFPRKPGSQAAIRYGDLGTLREGDRGLASWNRVSGRLVSGPRRVASALGYAHVRGVGGSTLHFTGEAHRLNPRGLRLASEHGGGADWPLSFAELAPYYDECERLIGVAGPAAPAERYGGAGHLQPPHPPSPSAARLAEAGRALGMTWQANSRAALSEPQGGRPACNYCGNCARGCPIGDKGSADVTFLRLAEATGNLQIETGAEVYRIDTDAGGRRATALRYLQDGARKRQETPALILAAGAVQTPRLMLASAAPEHPDGLGNGSGAVGRHFMETLSWASTGLLPGLAGSHKGLPADAICWDFNAPDAVPGALGGCRFTSAAQEIGLVGPIAYGGRLVDGFGAGFKQRLRDGFGSAVSVGAVGATLPDARSFVDLDPEARDAAGTPLPRIHSVLTGNSLTLLRFMRDRARALLAAAGVPELHEETGVWDQFTSTHVMGTCRMGRDSAGAVVDASGRAHDLDNLYIADASVFPSSGGGEGPFLTIQALALRSADALLRADP